MHNEEPWGHHFIFDIAGCNSDLIKSGENLTAWIKELVPAIDMVAYGEPIVEHFATHTNKTAGYSVIQLIETSNIAAHFAERIREARIDVFSCKEFDPDIVRKVSFKYFEYNEITKDMFFQR